MGDAGESFLDLFLVGLTVCAVSAAAGNWEEQQQQQQRLCSAPVCVATGAAAAVGATAGWRLAGELNWGSSGRPRMLNVV